MEWEKCATEGIAVSQYNISTCARSFRIIRRSLKEISQPYHYRWVCSQKCHQKLIGIAQTGYKVFCNKYNYASQYFGNVKEIQEQANASSSFERVGVIHW